MLIIILLVFGSTNTFANVTLDCSTEFAGGAYESAKGMLIGIVSFVRHPIDSTKGIFSAVTDAETYSNIVDSVKEFPENWDNMSIEEKCHFIGQSVVVVGTSVGGIGWAGKAGKVAKIKVDKAVINQRSRAAVASGDAAKIQAVAKARGAYWTLNDGRKLYLLTPEEFSALPPGTKVTSINGTVSTVDDLLPGGALDTRGGMTAYGFVQ